MTVVLDLVQFPRNCQYFDNLKAVNKLVAKLWFSSVSVFSYDQTLTLHNTTGKYNMTVRLR